MDQAQQFDANDPIKCFRDRFVVDDPNVIYMDGNSLGRLPKATVNLLENVVRNEWGTDLIDSWNKSWFRKSQQVGDKIAQLIGAEVGEVVISDNTSTNLYKLAKAAIDFQSNRNVIVSDEFNFPSDLYIFQGLVRENSEDLLLKLIQSGDGIKVLNEDIQKMLDSRTALLSLSHVAFKSAFMYDMKLVTQMAHDAGALVLWDLSHSTGAVPVNVKEANVDLAVGCTYKYLNGGPGAPAFLYVKKELQEKLASPIQGWFGAKEPFDFSLQYQPEAGIKRFLSGTPPILSVAGIEAGVDLTLDAGMEKVRAKSIQMSTFFIERYQSDLKPLGYGLSSPLNHEQRGSHLSLRHEEAFRICKALMDDSIDGKKIVPDFRAPNNIRIGFAPLYNSFEEIDHTVGKLQCIVRERLFEKYDISKDAVT
jgi:kynureninase